MKTTGIDDFDNAIEVLENYYGLPVELEQILAGDFFKVTSPNGKTLLRFKLEDIHNADRNLLLLRSTKSTKWKRDLEEINKQIKAIPVRRQLPLIRKD